MSSTCNHWLRDSLADETQKRNHQLRVTGSERVDHAACSSVAVANGQPDATVMEHAPIPAPT
jgi:hypothetical protein